MNNLKLISGILLLCTIFILVSSWIIGDNLSKEYLSIVPILIQQTLMYLCVAVAIASFAVLLITMYIISKFQDKIDELEKKLSYYEDITIGLNLSPPWEEEETKRELNAI